MEERDTMKILAGGKQNMAVTWFSFQADFRSECLDGLAAAVTPTSSVAPGTGQGAHQRLGRWMNLEVLSVRKEHRKPAHPHQVYPSVALTFLGSWFYMCVC